jgi:hypothetical protein
MKKETTGDVLVKAGERVRRVAALWRLLDGRTKSHIL